MKLQKELRISLSTDEYKHFCDALRYSESASKSDYLRRLIRGYPPKELPHVDFGEMVKQCKALKESVESLCCFVTDSCTCGEDIFFRCQELKLNTAVLYQKILDTVSTAQIEGR